MIGENRALNRLHCTAMLHYIVQVNQTIKLTLRHLIVQHNLEIMETANGRSNVAGI